jgi:hypothetical protein
MHPPNPVNLGAIGFSLGLLRKTSYQKNATDRIPAFSKRERHRQTPSLPYYTSFFVVF